MQGALIPLALLAANLANIALQFLIPRYLPPEQYAEFALLWSGGQFLAVLAYEWMRCAVVRFSIGADRAEVTKTRTTLLGCYVVGTGILLALALAAATAVQWTPGALLMVTGCIYAACQGTYDGRQALARAELDNARYAVSWIFRSILGLILAIAVAFETHSGLATLLAFSASYPLTLAIFGLSDAKHLRRAELDRAKSMQLFRFGIFMAGTSAIAAILPLLMRGVFTATLGAQQAGGAILAFDVYMKLMQTIGLLVNLLFLQSVIRTSQLSPDGASRETQKFLGISIGMLAPVTAGLFLTQESFSALFVPASYGNAFREVAPWAIATSALAAFRAYSLDSLFVLCQRTGIAITGSVIALAVAAMAYVIPPPSFLSVAQFYCVVFAIASAVGAAASASILRSSLRFRWRSRSSTIPLAAVALMLGVVPLVAVNQPLQALIARAAVGATVYISILLITNWCGLRTSFYSIGSSPRNFR